MPNLNNFDFGQIRFKSDSVDVLSLSPRERDFEFPLTKGPINFSVLRSDGLLSNRWGVKTKKTGDAYVYLRDVPGGEKVSLHPPNEQHSSSRHHISIGSETAARVGMDSRFGNVWEEPEFEGEAVATFSLIFPPWGVGVPFAHTKVTKDELLIVGHEENLVVVGFFVVDSTKKVRGGRPYFSLGELPLRPGRTLHVIAWKEAQDDFMDRIRSVFPQVVPVFSELELGEDDYTLCIQGYRRPNSAYMVRVPVRFTPPHEAAHL